MKFAIPADTVKALLLAAAKKDVRYYLNGILFDVRATDVSAVATNGHILVAMPIALADDSPAAVPGQYIIPREIFDGFKTNKNSIFTLELSSDTVSISYGGATTSSRLYDARFPNWRSVIPHSVSGLVSQFDADYVAAFGKINTLLGAKYSPVIRHNGDGKGEGAAARVELAAGAIGVLMPMRSGEPQPIDNPSWMLHEPAKVAAAA